MTAVQAKPAETFKALIGMIFFLPLGAIQAAGTPAAELRERIEVAFQSGDAAAIAEARDELLAGGESRAGYFAAHALFRQALLAEQTPDLARTLIEQCIGELGDYVAAQPGDAEARALLGSCYGISTRYNRMGMASRGLKARSQMQAARELAPDNPWVVLQDGMADFATPRMFGGDRELAIRKLQRATALFAAAAESGLRIALWGRSEAWQQLALMYEATGRAAEAADALRQARAVLPVQPAQQLAAL